MINEIGASSQNAQAQCFQQTPIDPLAQNRMIRLDGNQALNADQLNLQMQQQQMQVIQNAVQSLVGMFQQLLSYFMNGGTPQTDTTAENSLATTAATETGADDSPSDTSATLSATTPATEGTDAASASSPTIASNEANATTTTETSKTKQKTKTKKKDKNIAQKLVTLGKQILSFGSKAKKVYDSAKNLFNNFSWSSFAATLFGK